MKNAAVLCLVLLAAVPAALAWGNVGHEIIASIANSLINDECTDCATDIANILGTETMVSVSTWADKVRTDKTWRWTAPLHYVDTADWACTFDYDADCPNDMCVVGALNNFTQQINDVSKANTIDWQKDSLKFVIHFAGDSHQPLHVAFASDRGGNSIKGKFENKKGNLHEVWDNQIIAKRMKDDFDNDQDEYTAWLLAQAQGAWANQSVTWAACPNGEVVCADDWANETAKLACSNAYKDSNGNIIKANYTLSDDYYNFNSGVVDQQLAKAGVRLSATLQRIFTSARLRRQQPATTINADEAMEMDRVIQDSPFGSNVVADVELLVVDLLSN